MIRIGGGAEWLPRRYVCSSTNAAGTTYDSEALATPFEALEEGRANAADHDRWLALLASKAGEP